MSERELRSGDPELDADPRVLALLGRGAPANGIDLAPWWRANASTLVAPPKQRQRSRQSWAAFAAMFAAGAALGFVGGHQGRISSPANVRVCKYTAQERAALDGSTRREDLVQRRALQVALCSTCHVNPPKAESEPARNL